MTIAKTIPKPRNWQDFEKLCKKLFGELWGCPTTIKANGRSGQTQHGVDISGVPKNHSLYWGVQCKGKDDYQDVVLTKKEVEAEIEKARKFQPPLESFFLATTASKDVHIEEHVRKLDLASRQDGGFEIQLFCWEDLADLIEENKATFNWWIRERRHKELFDLDVSLADGARELIIRPQYRRATRQYYYREQPTALEALTESMARHPVFALAAMNYISPFEKRCLSKSWIRVPIRIKNTGQEVIEDYRITFSVEGGHEELCDPEYSVLVKRNSFYVADQEGWFSYDPHDRSPLTQEDSRRFTIAIRPHPKEYDISLSWKLFSRDFPNEGKLLLHVVPEFDDDVRHIRVKDPGLERTEVTIEEVPADQAAPSR